MKLDQAMEIYGNTLKGCYGNGKKKMAALKAKKKKDPTDVDASDTFYGPNTGGMGPAKALDPL